MLGTLDFTIRIGNTPTFLYFHLYLFFISVQALIYVNDILLAPVLLLLEDFKGFIILESVGSSYYKKHYPKYANKKMHYPNTENC